MTKQITTVYLEEQLIKKARGKDSNLSRLVDRLLRKDLETLLKDMECKDCGAVWNPSKIKSCPQCNLHEKMDGKEQIKKVIERKRASLDKFLSQGINADGLKAEIEKLEGEISDDDS